MKLFLCTECERAYLTQAAAGRCHWGIGGAEEVESDRTAEEINARIDTEEKEFLAAIRAGKL